MSGRAPEPAIVQYIQRRKQDQYAREYRQWYAHVQQMRMQEAAARASWHPGQQAQSGIDNPNYVIQPSPSAYPPAPGATPRPPAAAPPSTSQPSPDFSFQPAPTPSQPNGSGGSDGNFSFQPTGPATNVTSGSGTPTGTSPVNDSYPSPGSGAAPGKNPYERTTGNMQAGYDEFNRLRNSPDTGFAYDAIKASPGAQLELYIDRGNPSQAYANWLHKNAGDFYNRYVAESARTGGGAQQFSDWLHSANLGNEYLSGTPESRNFFEGVMNPSSRWIM